MGSTDAEVCHLARATFSGGCFWCLQPVFDTLHGVVSTAVGYTGGRKKAPTHAEVAAGRTGHAAAVQVLYDPNCLSYGQLLEVFWHNTDPTTPNRQFCAIGAQYRAAIFYHDATQRQLAEDSKQALAEAQRFEARIATRITPFMEFYKAPDTYQYYYRQQPLLYRLCQSYCGRMQRLQELWGEPCGAIETLESLSLTILTP